MRNRLLGLAGVGLGPVGGSGDCPTCKLPSASFRGAPWREPGIHNHSQLLFRCCAEPRTFVVMDSGLSPSGCPGMTTKVVLPDEAGPSSCPDSTGKSFRFIRMRSGLCQAPPRKIFIFRFSEKYVLLR